MSTNTSITVKVDSKIAKEFERIAQDVGYKNAEALIQNYIREVIVSARVEQAVTQLRDTVVRGSSDLDALMQERSVEQKK